MLREGKKENRSSFRIHRLIDFIDLNVSRNQFCIVRKLRPGEAPVCDAIEDICVNDVSHFAP